MTDFHAHCLPGIDDGARDVEMACEMLRMASNQGVSCVVATPHFYWGNETVSEFLKNRQAAYDSLAPYRDTLPEIRLGAEVLLREGVSQVDLRPLCLEGTDILLVELPFMRPPGWVVEELENIAYTQRLTVMLAHLDRYVPWYSASRLEPLLELPDVIVQINAESLADRYIYRDLRNWLPEVDRLVLGSDMHNLTDRASAMEAAYKALRKKRQGRIWLDQIEETTEEIV